MTQIRSIVLLQCFLLIFAAAAAAAIATATAAGSGVLQSTILRTCKATMSGGQQQPRYAPHNINNEFRIFVNK